MEVPPEFRSLHGEPSSHLSREAHATTLPEPVNMFETRGDDVDILARNDGEFVFGAFSGRGHSQVTEKDRRWTEEPLLGPVRESAR